MEKKRAITAWVFLFITFAAVYKGGWVLGGFLLALMLFGMKELLFLFHSKDIHPSIIASYAGCFFYLLFGCLGKIQYLNLVTICLVTFAFLAILRRGKGGKIMDIGATLICILYGGLLPSHFLFLRNMQTPTIDFFGYDLSLALGFVVLMVVSITATDVGAYFVGCKFGKHKLWEAVSPKKTIEGSVAGATFSILFAVFIGHILGLALWQSLLAGALITISAQLGDLVESMMKRDAGAKDASDILPGHGGLLDRADSYIFTVAVVYYFVYYFVVHPFF